MSGILLYIKWYLPSADLTGRGFSEVRDNIASSRGTMYVISDDGKGCEVVVKVPIRIDRA